MAQNDARAAYIGGREKPTEAEVRSMTLTGGTGAMRALLEAGAGTKNVSLPPQSTAWTRMP